MESQLETVEEKLESTGIEQGNAEKALGAEKAPENEQKRAVCAENKTENTEEASAHAGEAATEKTSAKIAGKNRVGKNKISRNQIAGGMELAAAFILALLSGWMFFNTRGTRLLYISVTTGLVSRYYWIFLTAAVIFLVIGVFTLRFRRSDECDVLQEEQENLPDRDKKVEREN